MASPTRVVDVEVVLHDPALRDLQMPAILLLVPDGHHDAGRLAALHNRDYLVGLRFAEIWIQKRVTAVFRCLENWCAPLLRTVAGPVLELAGSFAQNVAAHRILPTIGVKEADHSFRLLKRLN
jgi:hypothetical protein